MMPVNKDLLDLRKRTERLFKQVTSRKNLNIIGQLTVDIIYKRVKAGKGVDDDTLGSADRATNRFPEQTKLDDLSETYINFRKKNRPRGKFASVRRSNLTYTGQMLEALGFRRVGTGVEINIKETFRYDTELTNRMVAEFASEKRPFLALTKKEFKIIEDKVRQIIDLEIKRIFF